MIFYRNLASIRSKMLITFIPVLLFATVSIATIAVLDAKNGLEKQIETRVSTELSEINESIEHEFTAHRQIAQAVASVYKAKENDLTKADYKEVIEKLLSMNSNTLGSGLWLENYAYNSNIKYFGPYVYKDGDEFVYTEEYEAEDYDYPNTDWYLIGKSAEEGVGWTNPYYDETTGITMITAAVPINTEKGIAGVVSADYDLATIQLMISEVKLERSGYAFLLDSNGQFIAHKDADKVMKQAINDDKDLSVVSDKILSNDTGSLNVKLDGKDFKADYLTLKSTGWKLVVMAPTGELFSSVNDMVLKSVIITIAIILLTIVFIIIYSASFSKGIKQFAHNLRFLAQGDFTRSIEIKTKDEIGKMGEYYNDVISELRHMVNSISMNSESVASMTEVLAETAQQASTASEEVAKTIEEIAKGATDQAKDTEVAANNVDELGNLLEQDLQYI